MVIRLIRLIVSISLLSMWGWASPSKHGHTHKAKDYKHWKLDKMPKLPKGKVKI